MAREILDRYYTPELLAQKIIERLLQLFPEIKSNKSNGLGPTILEPSAGQGVFVKAVRSQCPTAWIDAVDLDAEQKTALGQLADGVFVDDFANFKREPFNVNAAYGEGAAPKRQGYDLIIGNPPYSLAEEHVRHAISLLAEGGILAFLLRINIRGSGQRLAFFDEYPHYLDFALVPRPGFKLAGKTDMTEYAVFVWRKMNGRTMPFGWLGDGHVPYAASIPALNWREVRLRKKGLLKRMLEGVATDIFEEL